MMPAPGPAGDQIVADQPGIQPMRMLLAGVLFLFILPTNHTMALRLIFLFAALAMAMMVARRHGMPKVPVPIRWPLIAWVALALASVTWSEKPAFSLGEIKTEIGYGMAAFFSFFILTRSGRELHLWTHVAVASLTLTLTLGLIGYVIGYQQQVIPYMRWDLVHGYASFSTYLATAVPILCLWFAITDRRWRVAGYLIALVMIVVAYLLGNRMFWVSTAGGLAAFAIAIFRQARDRTGKGKGIMTSLVTGIAVCFVLFIATANQRPVDFAKEPNVEASTPTHLVGVFARSERLYLWSYWVDRISERPWTGVGFGRDLPHWVYEKPKEWPDLYFAHAHNLVLDYGAQLGIPGIVVLLWLFGAMTLAFFRFARSTDSSLRLAGATGLGLVVAVFSKNMADDLFWRTDALVFWSFAGMLLGYGFHRAKELASDCQ